MIHLGILRVCNVAVLIHSLGGTKTKDTTSSCHPRLLWKKHRTIEMWLPREPEMGGGCGEQPEVAVPASQPLFWASAVVASCSRVISRRPGAKATVPKARAAAGVPGERGGLRSGGHARRAAGGAGSSRLGGAPLAGPSLPLTPRSAIPLQLGVEVDAVASLRQAASSGRCWRQQP